MSDWKEISVEDSDMWDRQKPLEGKLVKVQSNVGPNESMLYTVKTQEGNVGVWGSTVLDTKFAGIANESMIRVEPQGKVKSEKSGREYQDFKVFVKPPEFEEVDTDKEPLPDFPSDFLKK